MTDLLVVLSTFPSADKAAEVADVLIDERLAACVNLVPGLTSIYRWKGGVARDAEVLAMIKTTKGLFAALSERLRKLHPYELPEIVALDVEAASPDYLAWVKAEVTGRRDP